MRQTRLPLREAEQRFLDHHRRANHAPGTIAHYEQTFADLAKWIAETNRPVIVGTLTTSNVQAFQRWLEESPIKPYRGATTRTIQGVHGRLKDLRAFLYWLAEEGLIGTVPKVTMPKLPENAFAIFSDTELDQLFSCRLVTSKGDAASRNLALISLLLDTGIRLAEAATATLADLDLDHQQALWVLGKGSRRRQVPFSEKTRAHLRDWLRVRGSEPGALFHLKLEGIKALMERLSTETGLRVHPHRFRHTACTLLLRQGMDLHSVRRIMGHSSLTVTERYLSLTTDDLARKHAAASPVAYLDRLRAQQTPEDTRPKRRRYA